MKLPKQPKVRAPVLKQSQNYSAQENPEKENQMNGENILHINLNKIKQFSQ